MTYLAGIAASDGIAIAPAYLLTEPDLSFERVAVADTDAEVARLDAALAQAKEEITAIRDLALDALGAHEAQVFEAHLLVLGDPELTDQIKNTIRNEKVNAEAALRDVSGMFIQLFKSMEDNPYMQERAADIKDVSERVLAALLGVKLPSPATISEEAIVIAHDLTPSDTAQLNKKYVRAFVTNIGGRTSHSAIMARSLEIPAIVGTKEVTQVVKDGDLLIVDALEGKVLVNPSEAEVAEYRQKAQAFADQKAEWAKLVSAPSVTKDGKHVELAANIGTPKDVAGVLANGGEAVGLYRTEFLYMDSADFPTEDEQYEAYKAVLESMAGKPVVVRTMDIGGDKELPYLNLPKEMNPFLGWRAVRIALDRREILHAQLRAVLRASAFGKLAVMFPMIISVEEIRELKSVLETLKAELRAEGKAFDENIQVGVMVETPSAAVNAKFLAKEVDFFSIGTNDLTQYTLAVDRGNELISHLYNPMSPSVLGLIKQVIDASHAEGKWTGMCGELAGDERATLLLLGMGLDEFSMSAISVPRIKKLIRHVNYQEVKALADEVLQKPTAAEIEQLIQAFLAEKSLN